MSQKIVGLIIIIACLIVFQSCEKESPVINNRLVVGIPADVQTFNPLFAFNLDEGNINELLFLSLVSFDWDEEAGDIIPQPMLAKSWEWNVDSTSLTFNLRDDVLWSDSVKCTAEDVVYSFALYSDPVIQSKLLGSFRSLYLNNDGSIDLEKSFEIENPYRIKINFVPGSVPTFYEIIFPLIPGHIFEKLDREDIGTAEINFNPVTNGPYRLERWQKDQSIVLTADENSFLQEEEGIKEIVFKVIPDYNSRLTQLKNKEIDIAELIKPDDISEIKKYEHLKIQSVRGRDYDYIGWNNIDPEEYQKTKQFKPNKFFSDAETRRALSYSINREEILNEFLADYGELSSGPVSPVFKYAMDNSVAAFPFNIDSAKTLLRKAGWQDKDNNGIVERNGNEFRFTLYVPSGNPRRSYASTIVKNNLRDIGIEVTLQTVEIGVMIEDMYSRKLDAWMVGLFVPIPLDLRSFWFSDLENTSANFAGYRNFVVDSLIIRLEKRIPYDERIKVVKELQKIIHNDEPVCFLYWIDNIVVYNSKLKNTDINPLGVIHHCWNWSIN
ncbi:MAG: hypothetical protein IPM56_00165 [Ignavibacteriales bacterium]|nr:MAG: hypothetical protein IPM56_00165 [Ignavibacteriales bacterium]